MKIAIFHNFIDNIGGAEIVSLTLARELNADIYTTNIDPAKIGCMGFEDVLPRIFSIGKVPIRPPWRQQIALGRFRRLMLDGKYDFFVIAGDWAVSGAVKNRPNLWYVHSPIREIWDLHPYVKKNMVPFLARPFFDLWVAANRYLNRKYVSAVGCVVCNSENTLKRVDRFLKRKAIVVHPPVETLKFHYASPGNYWLSVNRLIKHKRIDLQLKVFAGLPGERLIIVGSYEKADHFLDYAAYCKKEKTENVEIRSWVSQEELKELYAHCKGLVTTSHDEDFGMNAVEAMASGKPVIAPDEGGYRETVLRGRTGLLIRDIDEKKLRDAILELKKELEMDPEKYRKACQTQASRFDTRIFIEKIKKEMDLSVDSSQKKPAAVRDSDDLKQEETFPFVTIIIVHFNGKRLLGDCLDSLRRLNYPKNRHEILVVDNGSTDGSLKYLGKKYPEVRVLSNDFNNYCRANNLGIREARGEYVALLNNDTQVDRRWLAELVGAIRSSKGISVVGSKVLFFDGRIQSAGHQQLPNYHWGDRGLKEADQGQYSQREEVISVSNVSALYKKEALEQAGFFDEDFRMYSEDLDMNYRLRGLGHKIVFEPASLVFHSLHGSQRTNAFRQVAILKSRLRFLAKHFPEKLPEHLFGFGEILLLADDRFDEVLHFIKQDLPKYLEGKPELVLKLNSEAEALRNFRKRSFRTVPGMKLFGRVSGFLAGSWMRPKIVPQEKL